MDKRKHTMAHLIKTSTFALLVALASQGAFAAQDNDDFVEDASAKGVAEVEAGKLAQEKGSASDVKLFADMMVKDHTAANSKLKMIADKKNLEVSDSAELVDKAKAMILELRSSKSFDQAYANNQVKAHEATIALFEEEASNGKDADAAETLPKLKEHLAHAQALAKAHGGQRIAVALAHRVDGIADISRIADAITTMFADINAALTPIIGPKGVAALHRRNLLLCTSTHPQFAEVFKMLVDAMDLRELRSTLIKLQKDEAVFFRHFTMSTKVTINRLATGVPGFDEILGGGLPEFSFNLIAGPPGCGKTTLAHQMMFALATPERPAIFFTVLGEPPLKMLRYQQQFSFFDEDAVNRSIRYVNLADDTLAGDLDEVLRRIVSEVETHAPALVFVDSFRSVVLASETECNPNNNLPQFVQQLGMLMTTWHATTFLLGEYFNELDSNPIFTVADGLIWLRQSVQRNSMVRKMEIMKMRGQPTLPGLHTFRIGNSGVTVYPPAPVAVQAFSEQLHVSAHPRLKMGIPRLDEMLGGGL
nr:hypothetical protein [Tanacetum cinerariifolium]